MEGRAYGFTVTQDAVRDAATVLATGLVLVAQGVTGCETVAARKDATNRALNAARVRVEEAIGQRRALMVSDARLRLPPCRSDKEDEEPRRSLHDAIEQLNRVMSHFLEIFPLRWTYP